ncbi:MAG: hypothetical protein JOZ90_05790 [Alphaproteobacteria bacterium]|nr:hypothetical protein [Alphaproteobacteria bacterium]MBV9370202.1 hypothetical protein [Alphaproteobacteria bacterium]MBV9900593.1 hypothetical protein [Alphaproteobacteria bacterium]
MTKRRLWLLGLALALLLAAGAMVLLKHNTDPRPGEPGTKGNVAITSGAVVVLLAAAAISARRRRRRDQDRNDG